MKRLRGFCAKPHFDDDAKNGRVIDQENDQVSVVLGRRKLGEIRRLDTHLRVRRQLEMQRSERSSTPARPKAAVLARDR